jgi:hypothetical protein
MATAWKNLISTDKGTTSQHLIKQFISIHGVVSSSKPSHIGHILGKLRAEPNTDVTYQTHSTIWISAFLDPASNTCLCSLTLHSRRVI